MPDTDTSRFAILLDGDLRATERVRRQIGGARILAADGGIRHAAVLGVEPELWLGDFDSDDAGLRDRFRDVPRETYPAEKAMSDGEIAIRYALDNGATETVLCGALGGDRSDHAFLNLAIAVKLARTQAVSLLLTSGDEEAIPLLPEKKLLPDWPEGTIFSVMCFSAIGSLSIHGAKWPLDSVDVPFGSTLTLSNVAGSGLEILLISGCGIAIGQIG
jgi:thiamine pyrophosphokinase